MNFKDMKKTILGHNSEHKVINEYLAGGLRDRQSGSERMSVMISVGEVAGNLAESIKEVEVEVEVSPEAIDMILANSLGVSNIEPIMMQVMVETMIGAYLAGAADANRMGGNHE
jgi:hypothetical protein